MNLTLIGQAVVMFAVTNIDDFVILTVFFGRAGDRRAHRLRVILGQYLGFLGILAVSVLAALGASLLPERMIPYLGLLPLLLGIRAGWQAWQAWRSEHGDDAAEAPRDEGVGILQVATVTFANGGDNIGVYVPVFAVAGIAMIDYAALFLVGVAIWCAAGLYFATRPAVAKVLSRWGDIILPVVLIAIGLAILFGG